MEAEKNLVPETLVKALAERTKVVVTHRSCADGFVSFLLLRDAFDALGIRCKYLALAHDKEHEQLPAEAGMLFVDMSPPIRRRAEFASKGAVVLDHHATAKELFAPGERGEAALEGVYAESPGTSGATLAAQVRRWLKGLPQWMDILGREDHLAQMIGVYDTWHRSSPWWSEARAATAMVHLFRKGVDERRLETVPYDLLKQIVETPRAVGRALVAAEDVAGETTAERAHIVDLAHPSGLLVRMALVDCKSDEVNIAADAVNARYEVDFVCSVSLVHGAPLGAAAGPRELRYRVSMRRRPRPGAGIDLDLGLVAKALGGGGHPNAAGFSLEYEARSSAYVLVEEAITNAFRRLALG